MAKNVETPDDTRAEPIEGKVVGAEVAVQAQAQIVVQTSIETLLLETKPTLPATLDGAFELMPWYRSLAYREPYEEKDPERVARKIMLRTFQAKDAAAVFEHQKPFGLQGLVRNQPGASTGPIDIVDLYVAESEHKTGVPCFMVMEIVSRQTGDMLTTTTGAQEVQAQVLSLIALGIWPISCEIKRIDAQDRGGRYMFRVFPLD